MPKRLYILYIVLAQMLSSIVVAKVLEPAPVPQPLATVNSDSIKVLRERLTAWAKAYSRPDCSLRPSKLASCTVDDSLREVTVVMVGGFSEQFFTPEVVDTLYEHVRAMLPKDARKYELSIIAEDHPIEFLIPNFFRKGKRDEARLPQYIYRDQPWVENISRPYRAVSGLEGKHIALWASHGKYIDHKKGEWAWQRPRLFCTTEDLLSQTIVIPYIIPMLENAGAVVYTPRERDWQRHEVVVDNDQPNKNGSYTEQGARMWAMTPRSGFAHVKDVYLSCDSPFCDGSARYIPSVKIEGDASQAQWVPNIPANGRYAVYVAYQSYENSVSDAHYTVYHKGGQTDFHVNQKMGGGTWVYLGTFDFAQGENASGMVVLSNVSKMQGVVTADAVRFGGGMGNIVTTIAENDTTNSLALELLKDREKREALEENGTAASPLADRGIVAETSGLPRWAEGAKYSTVWYGLPYQKHTEPFGLNDYNNDINSRSAAVNYLMGQSLYHPETEQGLRVPIDLTVAFHTDAGADRNDNFIGSLSIYKTDFHDGVTGAGLDRYVSRDLASIILTNLQSDLRKYNWQVRQLRNANYGEARESMSPVCILEMLSHQNFADMRMAYNPHFKFDYARSVYKSIVKFIATQHGFPYVIQPLPVTDFSISLNEGRNEAVLTWKPQIDPAESTATPTSYIVYTRRAGQGFDNGTIVKGTSCTVALAPDEVYSFRIAALNKGGESFPSETLSAGISSRNKGTVLIVNAFTRLEGPAEVNTDTECGFNIDADPGVPYGLFNGFCGRQQYFSRSKIGGESGDALGMSGNELEGLTMMGNTFDYPSIHGAGIMQSGMHSFTSCSEAALLNGDVNIGKYPIVDVIYGVQKVVNPATSQLIASYQSTGGKVIVSGTSAQLPAFQCSIPTSRPIQGCGLTFNIYGEMNEHSYCVPSAAVLQPVAPAFPILTYDEGIFAGIAQPGRFVQLGFPLESITERDKMNQLMVAFLQFLEQQ